MNTADKRRTREGRNDIYTMLLSMRSLTGEKFYVQHLLNAIHTVIYEASFSKHVIKAATS